MKKKKKALGPRRKRMQKPRRLESARATRWTDNYTGKNIVRGYCKWFAVDELCAVIELRILGVPISVERENELRQKSTRRTITATRSKERKKKLAELEEDNQYPYSDETFAFIAGYTSSGFAYGTTWEELGETYPLLENEENEQARSDDSQKNSRNIDELPF